MGTVSVYVNLFFRGAEDTTQGLACSQKALSIQTSTRGFLAGVLSALILAGVGLVPYLISIK